MKLTSILSIYVLFLVMSFFLVIPFGVRTAEEAGAERMHGHAESAPHGFSFGKALLRAAILGAILFGIYYANYVNGWVTAADLDWSGRS